MELKSLTLVLALSLIGSSLNARPLIRCTKQKKVAPPTIPVPVDPKKPVIIKKTKKITEWTWTYTEIPCDRWKPHEIPTDIV
jgi:hypothetical protein